MLLCRFDKTRKETYQYFVSEFSSLLIFVCFFAQCSERLLTYLNITVSFPTSTEASKTSRWSLIIRCSILLLIFSAILVHRTSASAVVTHTHTHTFNGPLSRTNRVSRYQKGKPMWILLKQETVSGSSICWAICKPAPRSRQITTPAPHHSVFYRPDALPAAQLTASKH